METSKLIDKKRKISDTLRQAYIKDLKNICDMLCTDFNIYDRNKGETNLMKPDHLYKYIIEKYDMKQNVKRCCAITTSGNQCTNSRGDESKYCKKHNMRAIAALLSNEQNDGMVSIQINQVNQVESNIEKENLKKKFIDDSFYYVNDKFIYDNEMKKVGIVYTKQAGETEYMLTSDPFILESMVFS